MGKVAGELLFVSDSMPSETNLIILQFNLNTLISTVEALVGGHPREAAKVSATGAGRYGMCKYRVCMSLSSNRVLSRRP